MLDDVEFLGRLYDLDALPSTDSRFRTARGDILQHRVANPLDWEDDWIFSDSRFGLADGDDALVRFLAEMLHPAVRTDLTEVEELRAFLNSVLIHDGYEIAQNGDISGAPNALASELSRPVIPAVTYDGSLPASARRK